jgi:flagellar basal body rod protein FlgG
MYYYFFSFNIFANDILFNEYKILYNDLENFNTFGYKSSWDIENSRGSEIINISQGAFKRTGFGTNFAIVKEGFFKIKLENGTIGYTRYGDFHIGFLDADTDSGFTLRTSRYGYQLYDQIIIPSNTVSLKLEGNALCAFLPDDEKVEVGQINVYEIDVKKLIRYKEGIFITSDNYNSLITNNSKIITRYVEMSNVNVIETLMRMHIVLWELKNYGFNFDVRSQIILMLINNFPIIDELITIRIELLNIQEKLLKDDEKIITEYITTKNDEIVFPFKRSNPLYDRIALSEIYRYDLLRSSIKFLKIE